MSASTRSCVKHALPTPNRTCGTVATGNRLKRHQRRDAPAAYLRSGAVADVAGRVSEILIQAKVGGQNAVQFFRLRRLISVRTRTVNGVVGEIEIAGGVKLHASHVADTGRDLADIGGSGIRACFVNGDGVK